MDLLGAAAGHPSLIGRDDLATAVAAFFPSKSEGDIAKLVEAARRDQPDGEFVDFIKLFEEDSKKNQGEFVTMIYAQHLREITAYDAEVTAAIRSVGKGAVPLLAVREALRKVDPTSTDEDVDARVAKGASLSSISEAKTRCELGATVETEGFVSRLHTGLLKRRNNFDLAVVRKYRPEGYRVATGARVAGLSVGGLGRVRRWLICEYSCRGVCYCGRVLPKATTPFAVPLFCNET